MRVCVCFSVCERERVRERERESVCVCVRLCMSACFDLPTSHAFGWQLTAPKACKQQEAHPIKCDRSCMWLRLLVWPLFPLDSLSSPTRLDGQGLGSLAVTNSMQAADPIKYACTLRDSSSPPSSLLLT